MSFADSFWSEVDGKDLYTRKKIDYVLGRSGTASPLSGKKGKRAVGVLSESSSISGAWES